MEQTAQGARPPAELVASFDGLGVGFDGPQGPAAGRNPSDNSLAAEAMYVRDRSEQVRIYGAFVSRCARCHDAVRLVRGDRVG